MSYMIVLKIPVRMFGRVIPTIETTRDTFVTYAEHGVNIDSRIGKIFIPYGNIGAIIATEEGQSQKVRDEYVGPKT